MNAHDIRGDRSQRARRFHCFYHRRNELISGSTNPLHNTKFPLFTLLSMLKSLRAIKGVRPQSSCCEGPTSIVLDDGPFGVLGCCRCGGSGMEIVVSAVGPSSDNILFCKELLRKNKQAGQDGGANKRAFGPCQHTISRL